MKKPSDASQRDLAQRRNAAACEANRCEGRSPRSIAAARRAILPNGYAPCLKINGCHRYMREPHFRDRHFLLDDQSDQMFAMPDPIAERIGKVRGTSCVRSDTLLEHHPDIATASLTETRIDEIDRRTCLRFQATGYGELSQ